MFFSCPDLLAGSGSSRRIGKADPEIPEAGLVKFGSPRHGSLARYGIDYEKITPRTLPTGCPDVIRPSLIATVFASCDPWLTTLDVRRVRFVPIRANVLSTAAGKGIITACGQRRTDADAGIR